MRAALRSLWLSAVAVTLMFLISGAPQWVTALLGTEDCCSMECEGSFGTTQCPPNCSQGPCAKMLPALVAHAPPASVQPSVRVAVPRALTKPRLSADVASVFHPPKA